jgi:hypothetical protein
MESSVAVRLSGSGGSRGRGLGVDVGAEESLAEKGKDAALGLLACGRADIDEVVDAGGSAWGCYMLDTGKLLESKGNVRVWQSKSARLRTSVAQQYGEPAPVQRGVWRSWSMAGMAMAPEAKARIAVTRMLIVGVGLVWKSGWKW